MLVSKLDALEKQHLSSSAQELIDKLTNCPMEEFVEIAEKKKQEPWNGLRIDLFHYITLLDRMDDVLEHHIVKYSLDKEYPEMQEVSKTDEQYVCAILDFSYILLEHCYNKNIYNSHDRVFNLILSCSMPIRLSALKLTCLLSERFAISQTHKHNPPTRTKNLLIKLSTFFPPQVAPVYSSPTTIDINKHQPHSSLPASSAAASVAAPVTSSSSTQNSQQLQYQVRQRQEQHSKSKKNKKDKEQQQALLHISLLDCISSDSHLPQKWKSLDFKYYNAGVATSAPTSVTPMVSVSSQSSPSKKRNKKHQILNTQSKRSKHDGTTKTKSVDSNEEGLHHFVLSEETVRKLSFQQIYDKGIEKIPKAKWFDFVLDIYVAKAFNNKSYESMKLRQDLVTMKCLAVAAASCTCFYSVMTSSVFDEEPYLLSYMSDLINPDNSVAFDPSYAALRAFVSISGKKNGGSDLMRALGGNVNHGLLFHILRSVLKAAKEDRTDMDHAYLNYFFNLIANLVDNKHLVAHLRTAGLMNILLEFLTLRNSFRMTRSGPLQLVELFLKSLPEALDDFIASNGFKILIDLLAFEVDFALDNPGYDGGAPTDAIVSHTISVRQVKTINSLLKLVFHIIVNNQGDRMRNLYDSPILKSLIKIMQNPTVFGYELLTDTIGIFRGIINNEPTAYAILNEAGVVDAFFDNFKGFLCKNADLLLAIPDAIGAISLNKDGLQRVLKESLITEFFKVFKSAPLAKELLKDESAAPLGFFFDELARHHPDLEPTIRENVLDILRSTPSLISFPPVEFYQSPKGSFYYSREEEILNKEEGGKQLDTWQTNEQADILECTPMFLSALIENSSFWKKITDLVTVEECTRYVTIENTPFNYVISNSLYSVTKVMEFFDEEKPAFALKDLIKSMIRALDELHDFIHFDRDDISYFDQFDKNNPIAAKEGGAMLSKLGVADCVLYVFSDIYGSPNKLSSARMQQISTEFASDEGIKLLKEMQSLYRRITLEDVIIHSRTPGDVCKEVVSADSHFSSFQLKIGKKLGKNPEWEGTSAKFKNLTMLSFHFTRCQHWLRYTFACLCRMSSDKRQDNKYGMVPKNSIRIVTEFSKAAVDSLANIRTENIEVRTGYYLMMINEIYLLLFMKSRSTDQTNPMLVICLLQNGGLILMRQLAVEFFTMLKSLPADDISKYESMDYIDINVSSTSVKLLSQILSLYASIATKSLIAPVTLQEKLYLDLIKNSTPYYREINSSILIQTSLASYGLLAELLSSEGIALLDSMIEHIPLNLIEKLIAISKNLYCSVTSSQTPVFGGRLYPLDYEQVSPSTAKQKYLQDLGLSESVSLEFLTFYRNNLDTLYAGHVDELEEHFDDDPFRAETEEYDWTAICEKASKNEFHYEEPSPIGPQYQHLCTLDDLTFHRAANESNFIDYWLTIAKLFPKSVYRVADLINSVFSKSSYGEIMEYTEVLYSVFMAICCFNFEQASESGSEETDKLSSLLHLLALLLDERTINKEKDLIDNIFHFLIGEIKPEYSSAGWFSHALLIFDRVFSTIKIPMSPTVDELDLQFSPPPMMTFEKVHIVGPEVEESFFGCLMNITKIESVESALSVARLLVLYCSNDAAIQRVCKSAVIKPLITCVQSFPDADVSLQNIIITLVRRCMESKKTLESYISKEIDRIMTTKKSGNPRVRDLMGLLKENNHLVMRSDSVFIDSIVETCILHQCAKPLKSLSITAMTPEQRKFVDISGSDDVQMKDAGDEKHDDSTYSTGIMQTLLTELMTIGKKDLISTPPMTFDEGSEKDKNEKKQYDHYSKEIVFKNTDCAYACFLLQTIAELLFSYKQAKTEFLTFSKKQGDIFTIDKPRSTALNLLIHQFISSDPFNDSSAPEIKRRRLLSLLAGVCIVALVSTTPMKDLNYEAVKIVDPDMTFVRKFTADILIRVLKDANNNSGNALLRYGKIADILDLLCKLMGEKYEMAVSSAVDKAVTQNDPYLLSRELLDKKLPSVLASILADLDLNFPYTEDIASGIMRSMSSLGSIKVSKQELFKEGALQSGEIDEEDLDDDDIEEREETPDLLRNSTLGMYDVEDIEDEDEEEDSEDDFLDGEDIEIIYSDGDGDDEDGDDGDDDEDMESDEDANMIDINQSDIEVVSFDEDEDDSENGSDSEDEDDSVDQLLDHEGQFVIDIGEPDSHDDNSDMDEAGDGYSDIEDSDELLELVNSDADIDGDDDEDEEDDNDDESNGTDDSAILEEWVAEHESNQHRRNNMNNRRNRHERISEVDEDDYSSFDDGDDDDDDDDDNEHESMLPRLVINPFDNAEFEVSGFGEVPPPVDGRSTQVFERSNLLNQLFVPRGGDGVGPTQFTPVNGGRLTDILRALNGGPPPPPIPKNSQVPNIFIKSTLQRWTESTHLFYGKTASRDACRVIPTIINRIYDHSKKITDEDKRKAQERLDNIRREREEALKRKEEEEEAALKARAETMEAAGASDTEEGNNVQQNADHEPVYVTIAGREVDISGTDIDPEFLQALPEDMREEVFAQHIRERRAEASTSGSVIPEIDPAFMAALPDTLRIDIIRDEQRNSLQNRTMQRMRTFPIVSDLDLGDADNEVGNDNGEAHEDDDKKEDKDKKRSKVFFSAMVDKFGVSALMKLVFLPQLYYKRESFFRTLGFLCYNKQTRSEIVAILLYILQEGLSGQSELEAVYHQLCQRSKISEVSSQTKSGDISMSAKTVGDTPSLDNSASFPIGCNMLTVATQAIDIIQYLLENESHMRFHFLMDQESNPFMRKLAKKHKLKDNGYRYPINILLNLLDNKLIKEDTNLIDILSRTFQIATRPLQAIGAKLNELGEDDKKQSKVPQLPVIPDRSLKQIINILVADECASKVFQQTISSIQNLSLLDNAKVVFPRELSKRATSLSQHISKDLRKLVIDMAAHQDDNDEIPSLSNFASGSSDQAKLLRVLTALDYLFQVKEGELLETPEVKELKELYKNSALGPLWGALSDCLRILRERTNLSHIATILSPLIEALMVVCKHSKVEDLPIRDVLRYEEKSRDFSSEPIESLFFSFTEEHKKILNQMIRCNPKLMSGPFSVLIRNPKVLEFDNKRIYFDQKLHSDDGDRPTLPVSIRRDQVFLDSYRALFFKNPATIRKSKLDIQFRGEQGVDAGGLTREWYQVLSRQMFNPDYALFSPVASDKTTFHPNRTSWVNPEHLSFFKFVGIIIGKAVYDGCMLDCHFSRAVYKLILGRPVSLKDIESLDLDYYKSLVWMLENDITDIIVETFSVETDDYGEHKIIDLKEDGRNIAVTEENKHEYVRLIVEYRLQTSVTDQMENFLQGFYQIISKDLIAIFDDQELELLISGLPDIDVDDWKNNTTYQNYSASSAQIQWFWRAVKSFDTEEKAKLLQFSTGTSKVPLNGFKELTGMSGVSKFSIHRSYGPTDRLPSSHTCFNQIDLPEYESYEKLRGSLLLAITEGHEGFGFA